MAYFYVYWCIMMFWIKIGHQNMWPTFWPYDLLSEIGIFWCILMYYDVLNQNGSQKHMTYFLWKWPTFRKIWKIAYFLCILMYFDVSNENLEIDQQNTWSTLTQWPTSPKRKETAYFYVYWCIMMFWIEIGHQNMWPTFWPYDLLSEIGIFWCILMYYDVLNQNGSQKHDLLYANQAHTKNLNLQ